MSITISTKQTAPRVRDLLFEIAADNDGTVRDFTLSAREFEAVVSFDSRSAAIMAMTRLAGHFAMPKFEILEALPMVTNDKTVLTVKARR